jgi:pentose-5-phosphate-3-epimerase
MEHGLPLSTGFESFHRWIATLPKRGIDPLHYDVMDFAALVIALSALQVSVRSRGRSLAQ